MRVTVTLALTVLGLIEMHSLTAQDRRASLENIRFEAQQSEGGLDHVIYVTNLSSDAIIVTGLRLYECENVQGACSTHRLDIRVGPGSHQLIYRVRPRFSDRGFGYRYSPSWKPETARPLEPVDTIAIPLGRVDSVKDAGVRATLREAVEEDKKNPIVSRPPARAVTPPATPAPPSVPESKSPAVEPIPPTRAAAPREEVASTEVDTVMVTPYTLQLRVGQDLAVGSAFAVMAKNRQGQSIPNLRISVAVETGMEFMKVNQGVLTGLKPGLGVILFRVRSNAGQPGESKGASRVLVRVIP